MKVRVLFFSLCSVLLASSFASANSLSNAILGVATYDGYAYASAGDASSQYISEFITDPGKIVPATDPAYHGFIVGASDVSQLIVFAPQSILQTGRLWLVGNLGYDNGEPTGDLKFGSTAFAPMLQNYGSVDGYKNPTPHINKQTGLLVDPYYGIRLPTAGWTETEIPNGSDTIWCYKDYIHYTGTLTPGDYFFVAYDANNDGNLSEQEGFSPKTKSAGGFGDTPENPIPEPASMMLLGTGLVAGLGFIRFKKS